MHTSLLHVLLFPCLLHRGGGQSKASANNPVVVAAGNVLLWTSFSGCSTFLEEDNISIESSLVNTFSLAPDCDVSVLDQELFSAAMLILGWEFNSMNFVLWGLNMI